MTLTYSYALKFIAACTQTDLIQWRSYTRAYPGLCPLRVCYYEMLEFDWSV